MGSDSNSFEKAIDNALAEADDVLKKKRILLAKERSSKSKSVEPRKCIEDAMENTSD